jgi:glycosyltransferase involved in cell wall biosynthesis
LEQQAMDTVIIDLLPPVSAPPKPPRPRLAIVSTTNRLCGIGAYTAALEKQLAPAFEVSVLELDQYLMRGRHKRLKRQADAAIHEICERLRGFDAVNLQLEHGTLGRDARDILRRFSRLVAAAPSLSVTFHSLHTPPTFPTDEFIRLLCRLKLRAAARIVTEHRRGGVLSTGIARVLRNAQRHKRVAAIAHNRRDRRELRFLHGVETVYDHPLAFLSEAKIGAIRARTALWDYPLLAQIPAGARLIGVFGFLNDYKGLGTAIRALRHLPDDHHLLVFGGIHPNEIVKDTPIHPYLATLYDEAYADATPYREISGGEVRLTVTADRGLAELIGPHPRDVSARIHFMGAPEDEAFLSGMAACDVVVLPYLEVGQSSSGPISQAVELGCRVIASRTHAFLGFAEYHSNAVEFFDIGNYLELAERIRAGRQFAPRAGLPAHNIETNRAVYVAANMLTADAAGSTAQARAARAG